MSRFCDSQSDSDSENSDDRAFIASESEESDCSESSDCSDEEKIKKELVDDQPKALLESMDTETRRLFEQSIQANSACGLRRSTRKRTRPKNWFEKHPEDLRVLLEDDLVHYNAEAHDSDDDDSSQESEYDPNSDTDSD